MAHTKARTPHSKTRKTHRYRSRRISIRRPRIVSRLPEIVHETVAPIRRSTRTRVQPQRLTMATTIRRVKRVANAEMNNFPARMDHFEKAKAIHAYIESILMMPPLEPPSTATLRKALKQYTKELAAASKGGMSGVGKYWADAKAMSAAIDARAATRSEAHMADADALNSLADIMGKTGI